MGFEELGESDEGFLQDASVVRNDHIWVVSCRNVRTLRVFSKRVLLYQPDMRNFCPKGRACPLQDDEVHSALYKHSNRHRDRSETVMANAAPLEEKKSVKKRPVKRVHTYDGSYVYYKDINDSNDVKDATRTTRFDSEVGTNNQSARIPHVAKAWQLFYSNSKIKSFKGTTRIDGIPQNKTICVFVHGFSEPFPRIVRYLTHMAAAIGIDKPEMEEAVNLMAFTWPSQTKLVPATYFRARFYAEQAGIILRKTLELLSFHGNRIILLAHSLGARVALTSLLDWDHPQNVSHLFLLAAGVGSDALSTGFPRNRLGVDRITACYSHRDPVRVGFGFAELIPGVWNMRPRQLELMGAVGIKGRVPKLNGIQSCESVNCTSQVHVHSVHWYFKSSIFQKHLKEAVDRTNPNLIAKL